MAEHGGARHARGLSGARLGCRRGGGGHGGETRAAPAADAVACVARCPGCVDEAAEGRVSLRLDLVGVRVRVRVSVSVRVRVSVRIRVS